MSHPGTQGPVGASTGPKLGGMGLRAAAWSPDSAAWSPESAVSLRPDLTHTTHLACGTKKLSTIVAQIGGGWGIRIIEKYGREGHQEVT